MIVGCLLILLGSGVMCSIAKQGDYVVGFVDGKQVVKSPISDFRTISIQNNDTDAIVIMGHRNGMHFCWRLVSNDTHVFLIYKINDANPKAKLFK